MNVIYFCGMFFEVQARIFVRLIIFQTPHRFLFHDLYPSFDRDFRENPKITKYYSLIELSFLPVCSKKIKISTWNTMASPYHSKVKTRNSHFSLVWVMEFSIISTCLDKIKVFSNNSLTLPTYSTFSVNMKTIKSHMCC